ncbi:MAG: MBL fold metallo-hydrolase [Acidobacteria bacterium]|nr:MBL fold metallo-hydrolase [Acidobacteriota bacterium]
MHIFIALLFAIDSLQTGTLPRQWRTSGPNCLEVPDWQVHEYNPNLYIIRESGCTNYEKPFLYLFFGADRALLQDSGAGDTDIDRLIPTLLAQWAKRNNRQVPPLLVVHSHSHGDHTSGDKKLAALPGITVVLAKPEEIEKALNMPGWPEKLGVIDLGGGRLLDAIPIPGHDTADLALYDRQTGLLLTGDTLYPGRLYVRNFPAYVKSIDRLVNFTKGLPVAHILGTHIEQTRTPFLDYKVRTVYQPDEAVLELSRGDLLELQSALSAMQGKPRREQLSRFTITPRVSLP